MVKQRHTAQILGLCLAFLASTAAIAQNRPGCLPAPTGPGSCFIDGTVFPSIVLTGVDLDGDFFRFTIPSSNDDFFKFLPNGRVSAHLTDSEASFTVCPATAPATCSMDGAGALAGTGRIQVNSFLAAGGVTSCPGSVNASASLSDGVTQFDFVYTLVTTPSPSGCRTVHDDAQVTVSP